MATHHVADAKQSAIKIQKNYGIMLSFMFEHRPARTGTEQKRVTERAYHPSHPQVILR